MIRAERPSDQYASPRPDSRRGASCPRLPLVEAVHPLHLARGSIECHDGAPRPGGRVQHAAHHERRRLEIELRLRAEIVGLQTPGDFERAEIGGADLIEWRIACARQRRPVRGPFAVSRRRLRLCAVRRQLPTPTPVQAESPRCRPPAIATTVSNPSVFVRMLIAATPSPVRASIRCGVPCRRTSADVSLRRFPSCKGCPSSRSRCCAPRRTGPADDRRRRSS